jgi:hypothetical protein
MGADGAMASSAGAGGNSRSSSAMQSATSRVARSSGGSARRLREATRWAIPVSAPPRPD